jgi:hypothetical protein
MAQIIVERSQGSLADRLRAYSVVIDGQVRGGIRQSENGRSRSRLGRAP